MAEVSAAVFAFGGRRKAKTVEARVGAGGNFACGVAKGMFLIG